ncbi:MAG: hypothetical protein PHU31_00515 [Anaerotignum sp.]|nr:hypothetical protein [Anaerotignum sp.]
MNKNTSKTSNSNKRKFAATDIILMFLGIFILIKSPWSNMNSFYYLLFFLYIFCIMMRITNVRKQNAKKEELQQKKLADELKALEEQSIDEPFSETTAENTEQATASQENTDTKKDSQV